MQNRFKTIAKECSLDGATFHTLRHTFATRCIECGFDAKTLSEILGHSDVNTTKKHYAATNDYMLRAQRNAVRLREKLPEKGPETVPKDEQTDAAGGNDKGGENK